MKGPPGVAIVAQLPRGALVGALAALLGAVLAGPRSAFAQGDPRHAVDRLEVSERGSEWFANESLDLRGPLRPSAGYVLAFAHRALVVPSADGTADRAPVKNEALLHVGGSLVVFERLRLALDLPFQVYADGEDATRDGVPVPAPEKEGGVGDLRLGADVRVLGQHRRGITAAVGVQAWAPTGRKSQWTSDGVFRARPRAMLSGEHGAFVWAAQLGIFVRSRSEVGASAAAGVRIARALVVGPEVAASTTLEDALAKRSTPVEAILGAHWLVDGTARIGIGLGGGLSDGMGAPSWRAIFGVEWAPEIPAARRGRPAGRVDPDHSGEPDEDRDGVPDRIDACPKVVGIRTGDPRTNGCPPDADDDGVDDLADACPTVRGLRTSDPMTNGCPDRDRDQDGIPNDLDACPDERGAADIDPRRNGCPKAFLRASQIELLDPVEWKGATAELATGAENEAILTAVLAVLLKVPEGRTLRIEGHTDRAGDRKLSAARAAAVGRWLVDHGIDASRVTTEGRGAERPIATNETEAGRAANRRLEFHLTH